MAQQTPDEVAERLGCSPALARLHLDTHPCWDGRTYPAGHGCLVTDPDLQQHMERLLADPKARAR